MKILIVILLSILSLSCKKAENAAQDKLGNPAPEKTSEIKYLALGDSYTIGESVEEHETFPYRLSRLLESDNKFKVTQTKIVARTGWTTQNLLDKLGLEDPGTGYNLVSLLIGVNNQYQGGDTGAYAQQFTMLIEKAIAYANGNKQKVFVVSIPDYGYTPFGSGNKDNISKAIDNFNAVNKRISDRFGVTYIDVTSISRSNDATLVADDGLHPSAKQYRLWTEKMDPIVKNLLVK